MTDGGPSMVGKNNYVSSLITGVKNTMDCDLITWNCVIYQESLVRNPSK